MLNAFRIWWPLLLAILCLQIGNGLQSTLIGLRTDGAGFTTADIATVMSALYVGNVAGSLLSPRLISRFGHVPYFVVSAAIIALAPALYLGDPSTPPWALARFLIGFGLAGVFIVIESWINERSSNELRGRVFALYILVQLAGLVVAQSLVPVLAVQIILGAAVVMAFGAISIPPVLASQVPRPHRTPHVSSSLGSLWQASPTGVVGAAISGVVWAMITSMSAIYAQRQGLDVEGVALFVGSAVLGGLVLQFPIGWLSDLYDRRLVLGGMALLAALAALAGYWDASQSNVTLVAYWLFGGLTFPFYTVAVSHLNDHIDPRQRVSASGAMVLIFGLGSVTGPIAASVAMEQWGPGGFFITLAAVTASLAAFAFGRAVGSR